MTQKDEEVTVAVVVRMGFRSLLDTFFVMGTILLFVVDSIPDYMRSASEQPRWFGIILVLGMCAFLWRFGKMVVTFVQSYLDMRDLYATIVVTMTDIRGKMTFGGRINEIRNED